MPTDMMETHIIHMSVQMADMHLIGYNANYELNMSCSLVNIARGNCTVKIRPLANFAEPVGHLEIEINRPVMKLDIQLQQDSFERLCETLKFPHPRPIDLIVSLQETLNVSVNGELSISRAQSHHIQDISWKVPVY